MQEKNIAILTSGSIILLGLIFSYFVLTTSAFNFYKSELSINENQVKETLFYKANKDYHTLFRNFYSDVFFSLENMPLKNKDYINSIYISEVFCESGRPYAKDINGDLKTFDDIETNENIPYTESNEYGCSFGEQLGFKKGNEYKISSEYKLNKFNLFKIKNKYYFKFIAYSKDKHKLLIKDSNFFIKGNVIINPIYLPGDDVIIYIQYKGDITNYNIIEQKDFLFDNNIFKNFIFILLIISPGVVLFLTWLIFGKEKFVGDIPDQLSQIPTNRKVWEVAAYFNPPFGGMDQNFTSSLILDLYRRKIISINIEDEDLFIKINKYKKEDLDEIELYFLETFEILKTKAKEKDIKNGYFNINAISKYFTIGFTIRERLIEQRKLISKKGKEIISLMGPGVMFVFLFFQLFFGGFIGVILSKTPLLIFYNILIFFVIMVILTKTSLLTRHKKDLYIEYQKWQAFKKWLSYSPSMKESKSKAVVMWEEYLCYATALGVSERVLKELKQEGIIKEKDYNFYHGVSLSTASFSNSSGFSGSSGGGGGFGGASGGGGGGGGGGGR